MKNKSIVFCSILVLLLGMLVPPVPVSSAGSVRYVAPGGSCGGQTPCYSSVQAAVDASAVGDDIRVAAGTYTGVNNTGGKPQHLYISKDLTITGGYTTTDWINSDPATNVTELQAQTLGRVVFVPEGVTAELYGLNLTYGNASGLGGHYIYYQVDAGAGIYAYKATLTLDTCQVLHNSTTSGGIGGGLYARESTLTIENSRFEDNTSGNGGAAYLYKSDSDIEDSEFIANQMSGIQLGDFALHVEEGTLIFTGNSLDGNFTSSGAGSAMGVNELETMTISGNQILGTASGTKNESGITLSYSTGEFYGNYVANHRNTGVSVTGGYVEMTENEIAYNNGEGAGSGGGVAFGASSLYASEFTMTANYIHHNTDNYSSGMGGGVYINGRTDNLAYLYGNIIQDNTSADGTILSEYGSGGGVYINNGATVTLVGNLIQRNLARGHVAVGNHGGAGGGVYISGNATLVNNIITDNQARFAGSGVYVNGSTPYLYHNTIANNIYSETEDGSGVYSNESASNAPGQPRLYNNIISNQTIGVYANKEDVTSLVFVENVLWHGNGQNTGGAGTIFVNDPHSGDPLYLDTDGYDYYIGTGSAAIDVGTNANIPAGITTDVANHPRIANGIVDLGAHENQDNFLLTVSKAGGGTGDVTSNPVGIDCGSDCTETYAASTSVTLTPTAGADSQFTAWSGHADCSDGQVTLTADKTCIATFIHPVSLTVTRAGDGTGKVTSSPAGINCGTDCSQDYDLGTAVSLTATASTGSIFTAWSGHADCSDGQVTMDVAKTCTATFKKILKTTHISAAAQDGWVLESSENSKVGGSLNATATTLRLGDDAAKKQYRSILSFNTGGLPNTAVITKVTLKVRKQGITGGGDPLATFQGFKVDIKKGFLGPAAALAVGDFQAAASKTYGPFSPALASGWYSINLTAGKAYINKVTTGGGLTQIRLYFKLDDNNNTVANYLSLYSGNAGSVSRPQLIVEYYVP